MWDQSLSQLFNRGGFVMWPLLGMSIIALAISCERAVFYFLLRRDFNKFVARLKTDIVERRIGDALKRLERDRHPLARVAAEYLRHTRDSIQLRHQVAGREASQSLVGVEKRLNWLATIGHLAPMLGLLGTVTGLISAFHKIERNAGQVQPSDLAGGIWEALLTTVFGLVVALPTLAVHHYFDQRVGAISMQMQWIVAYLDEWLGEAPASATDDDSAFAVVGADDTPGIGVAQ